MHIERIKIANFKGLRAAEFSPTRFSCLVGENNAGKSTVLQALVYALNRPAHLPPDLFYDPALPVEFRIELSGVSEGHLLRLAEEHRGKIAELISNERFILIVRYRVEQRVEVKIERLVPSEARYKADAIAEVFQGKRGNAVRQALVESYPEFADDAPQDLNIVAAKQHLAGKIRTLSVDHFVLEEGPLPSGISSSVETLLPEPIYIPAVKNLADDLKTSQSTSFGRLLGLLLSDMTPDLAAITASLDQLNSLFNRVERDGQVVDERHARVRALESTVERFLKENFPTAKVELKVPPPELRTILNAAQIFIDDGSRDLIDNKGDGIKRSLTFALLQCYVEKLAAAASQGGEDGPAQRPLIFLFEEPELYLHPKSQRVLFGTLARISGVYQVVVTTHSPMFFAPGITATFVRVAKKPENPKPVGVLHHVNFELDAESAEVFRMARFENADAGFFSQRVVLFEGESDDAYFKHVAKKLNPDWDFDRKNVALVRVSGKGNFAKFRRFFEAFGIEVKIVADLDALFDGYVHLSAGAPVTALRTTAIQTIDQRIAALGIKAEPQPRQIKDKLKTHGWRGRYDAAKQALRDVQQTQQVTPETLASIEGLFVWEDDIARVKACKEDAQASAAIVPVLDAARQSGICILSNGAIEDYYPAGAPPSGAKPERAMAAAALVVDQQTALGLSAPLSAHRETELMEICAQLFDSL
jgi:hypothetical protein